MLHKMICGLALGMLFSITTTLAQTGSKGWEVLLPGSAGGDDRFEDVLVENNHLITVGKLLQGGDETIFLAKYTLDGQQIWLKNLAISNKDLTPYFIKKGINGHYYVLGYQSVQGEFVAEFDPNGVLVQKKDLNLYSVSDMKFLPDGSIIFGGAKSISTTIYPYLFKYDQNLNPIWEKKVELPYPAQDINTTGIFSLDITPEGGYYLLVRGRKLISTTSSDDVIVAKTDGDGNLIWSKLFGGSGKDYVTDVYGGQAHSNIVTHPDGGFVFNCVTESLEYAPAGWPFSDFDDILVFRCDALGNSLWWQTSQSGAYYSNGVSLKPNGDILVYGLGSNIFQSPVYNPNDQDDTAYIFETDKSSGSVNWGNSFGSFQADYIRTVKATHNSSLIACGNKNGQAWLFSVIISGASSARQVVSAEVLSLTPNPVSAQLKLSWAPGDEAHVRVFNFCGNLMIEKKLEGAQSEISLDVSTLSEGIYQVVLLAPSGKIKSGKFYKR